MKRMKPITVLLVFGVGMAALAVTRAAQPGPKTRSLTEQEVDDILVGSSIQGTRNGNSAGMIKTAHDLIAQGKKFTMIAPDDLPDDWMVVAAAGGVGGGGAWEYVTDRVKQQNLPTVKENTTVLAANVLSKHIGKKFNAIIRNEADGAMIAALQSAVALDVPIVDACLAGRAKPELNLQISFANGISGTPAALVTRWGDVVILDKTIDDYRLEDLARAVAVGSGGGSSIARNPMTGRDVKRGTIKGAVTEAMLFGRTVREAKAQGRDPIDALLAAANQVGGPSRPAFRMFQGTVTKADHKGDRGFDWVDAELAGVNQFKGHTYRIYVKNENIISWLDGKPDILPPDLIYDLDPQTGDAVTGVSMGNYPVGKEVVIVGRASSAMWRTPKGLEIFSPRHFGFDVDYKPIEEIHKTRPAFSH
jgi:DUF917 family protein